MKSTLKAPVAAALLVLSLPALAAGAGAAGKDPTPEIRLNDANRVPACVTPDRLMAFLATRNGRLDARFKDIAKHYKSFGEGWRVRWDYAFFQMAVETNFLTYRRPDGRMGDVDPRQNNFAGIGTTGGGVPGDSFPDVKTGVLAQIQHLVAYSGERLAQPVAPRTQLKQDDIVLASRELGRPVHFSDLARRWAVDKRYGQSIEWVASLYRSTYCTGKDAPVPAAKPEKRAGAESLPWTTGGQGTQPRPPAASQMPGPQGLKAAGAATKAVSSAPAMTIAVPPKPVQAKRTANAVRTIWSKEGGATPAAASAAPDPDAIALARPAGGEPIPALQPGLAAAAPAPLAFAPSVSPLLSAAPDSATGSTATAPQPPPEAATRTVQAGAGPFDPAVTPPSGLGMKPSSCAIRFASFGGSKTLLVRSQDADGQTTLTALTVLDGFEKSMLDTYVKSRQPGGESVGTFGSREEALAKARQECPGA